MEGRTLPFAVPHFLPTPTNQAMEAYSARRKTKIKWLQDDATRRSTLKKRRKGIMKKAEELHILCGVKTCVIVFGAGERAPEVWPGTEEAARMCRGFRQMSEVDQLKMMRTHTRFLQELVGKKAQQLWHQHDEIADMQARCFLYDGLMGANLQDASRECLIKVHAIIREMLRDLYERCAELRVGSSTAPPTVSLQGHPGDALHPTRVDARNARMDVLVSRFLYGEDTRAAPEGNGGVRTPVNQSN